MTPDLLNGIFELCGGFIILLSIIKVHREKMVRGVSWAHVAFFSAWGFWNLFYYPSLDQWFSFAGGVTLVITNTIWTCQLVYWTGVEKRQREYVRASQWD